MTNRTTKKTIIDKGILVGIILVTIHIVILKLISVILSSNVLYANFWFLVPIFVVSNWILAFPYYLLGEIYTPIYNTNPLIGYLLVFMVGFFWVWLFNWFHKIRKKVKN